MSHSSGDPGAVLAAFSDQLATAVETAGAAVVRVEARARQAASGVVWGADGLILTADHVVERDEDIRIGLPDGRIVGAKVVGRDPGTDLALLRAEATGLRAIEPAPAPRVGHVVLIVARPGSGLSTSIGVISAIEGAARSWRGARLDGVIRTDATFYPGFSGGPLADTAGRIVGLATSHFGQGSGLAIPVETLGRVTATLQRHGKVKHGFLGVSSQPVPLPETLREMVGQESGLLVVGVQAGGPAEASGLLIGDVLVGLGGQPIKGTDDLFGQLGGDRIGQSVPARIIRGGQVREIGVTIGERE